jgi:hypothetical protein
VHGLRLGVLPRPVPALGPLLDLARRPLSAARRIVGDRPALRLWLEDLRYYRACGLFDGRRAPDTAALERFGAAYGRARTRGETPANGPSLKTLL